MAFCVTDLAHRQSIPGIQSLYHESLRPDRRLPLCVPHRSSRPARPNPTGSVFRRGEAGYRIRGHYGDKDPLVPHGQSELLVSALKKAGVPNELYTVTDGGHGGFRDPAVPQKVEEFLRVHFAAAEGQSK
jgi:pimeloyl-ACP methyl ester carboxylesterase